MRPFTSMACIFNADKDLAKVRGALALNMHNDVRLADKHAQYAQVCLPFLINPQEDS